MRSSRILAVHEERAAELGEFSGWRTVMVYSSTRREHRAVRSAAGIFDVSHMRRTSIEGKEAAAYLSRILTINASRLRIGRMKYCLMLNEQGGIIDDLTVMRLGEERFLLTSNAATSQRVGGWLERNNSEGVEISDITDSSVLLAIQGPRAEEVVKALLGIEVGGMRWFSFTRSGFGGMELIVSRSGYTGEDGFELFIPLGERGEPAEELWEETVRMGAEPCGLVTRDILRLECGYPLSQVDFDETLSPIEARLEWAVELEGHDFIGRSRYIERPSSGPRKILVGVLMSEGGVPRRGMPLHISSSRAGVITSGALSYSLGRGVALAHVEPDVAREGAEAFVEIKGAHRKALIRLGPFIELRIKR